MLIAVKLRDIVVDPKREVDLTTLPPAEAAWLIQKSYGFLAPAVRVEIQADTYGEMLEHARPQNLRANWCAFDLAAFSRNKTLWD